MDNVVIVGSALSALLLAIGVRSHSQASKKRQEESILKSKRIFYPDEIKNIIEKNEPLTHLLFSQDPSNKRNLLGKNMLIQGTLRNSNCLSSLLPAGNKKEELVMRINYDIPYYTNRDTYNILSEKRTKGDYYLNKCNEAMTIDSDLQPRIQIEKNGVICTADTIKGFEKPFDRIDRECFDHSTSVMSEVDDGFLKYILNRLGLSIAFIGKLFTNKDLRSIFCSSVKVDKCEIGIKNSGLITLFGDIIYDREKQELTVVNLTHIMKNKVQMLRGINQQMKDLNAKAIVYMLLSASFLSVATYALYQALERNTYLMLFNRRVEMPQPVVNLVKKISRWFLLRKQPQKVNLNQKNKQSIEQVYAKPRDGMQCIICYEKCRSVIIRPCFHCLMCQECYINLNKPECPVCKTQIQFQVPICMDLLEKKEI